MWIYITAILAARAQAAQRLRHVSPGVQPFAEATRSSRTDRKSAVKWPKCDDLKQDRMNTINNRQEL